MGLEKFRIRDDAKWGHPELEVAYSLMGNSVGYAEIGRASCRERV